MWFWFVCGLEIVVWIFLVYGLWIVDGIESCYFFYWYFVYVMKFIIGDGVCIGFLCVMLVWLCIWIRNGDCVN